ncbi:MAG: cellulose biosynthesis protein BcsS [Rickettsiales bacterium]|nr:cellulose biosynthesis protein BcsS [Rickettsiales bacterium]
MKHFALAACLTTALLSSAAYADGNLGFTGGSITDDTHYAYVGGVTAFNGDIEKDGWLLRVTAATGSYDYSTGAGGIDGSLRNIDGDVTASDFMAGYQVYFKGRGPKPDRLTGYLGLDSQNHKLSPTDLFNPVRGNETSVKGQVEVLYYAQQNLLTTATISYSDAFNTYWSRGSVGYDVGKALIGPEALFMGSESYDQQRYGLHISDVSVVGSLKAGISGGYSISSRRGDDSGYGEFRLYSTF